MTPEFNVLFIYCFESRRTSPVTVPLSSISRQRNESTSSVGSWQMVNQSGSLRSTDSTNLFQSLRSQNSNSQESNTTLVDDDIFTYNQNAVFMYLFRFSILFSPILCGPHPLDSIIIDFIALIHQLLSFLYLFFVCILCLLFFRRRRDRLQSVRSTFYQCYCKAIGFKYKNGAELTSLGSMLGNIAERVGLSTQRTQM